MAVYNVTYDLNQTGQNYEGLISEIKKSPKWCNYQKSAFLIQTNETSEQVYKRFSKYIDKNDRILIINCCGAWYGFLDQECLDWLHENIQTC